MVTVCPLGKLTENAQPTPQLLALPKRGIRTTPRFSFGCVATKPPAYLAVFAKMAKYAAPSAFSFWRESAFGAKTAKYNSPGTFSVGRGNAFGA